jgi:4-oxalocrotonate tautomerase
LKDEAMPIAQLYILEGRTDEQKETLIREVSEAMSRSLDAPLERVRVIITEMPKNHFGIGGEPASKVRR